MGTTRPEADKPYTLHYHSCRNISAPEDESAKRKVYAGHAPASSLLDLKDDENVRSYLLDAPGKSKKSPTSVHKAIRNTLNSFVEDFSILNGGIVIVAHSVEIDDKTKVMKLIRPSIINGSQTQGELRRYFERGKPSDPDFFDPSVKYELIVTDDDELIAEISISRNFQNDVQSISIVGALGQLEDLEEAVRQVMPGTMLRKSESESFSDDYLDTEKLVQVVFALMPDQMLAKVGITDSKVFTYNQKARCLALFQRIYEGRAGDLRDAYQYFLNIAGYAWQIYEKWKAHPAFNGSGLHSLKREKGKVVEVPDGIVFPIVASLSAFVQHQNGRGWIYNPPERFDEKVLVTTAIEAYQDIARHKPHTMGTSKACYSSCQRVTSLYATLG